MRHGVCNHVCNRVLRYTGLTAACAAGVAGLCHVGLLLYIFSRRVGYPLDLEWEEGGMLGHALRVLQGQSLYAEPSVDFISFLYTPFYPTVLAGLGSVFGLSYALGRVVSILSFLAVLALATLAIWRQGRRRPAGLAWGLAGAGLIAATYPAVGTWYDLVRNDTFYLALIVGAFYLLLYHNERYRWVVMAGALLALAFLTKQTAAIAIIFAGFAMLLLNWRKLWALVLVVGVIDGGSVLLLNHLSDGWFWRYIYEFHQGHEFSWVRALEHTPKYLFETSPVVFGIIAAWALATIVRWIASRRSEPRERYALYWLFVALVGVWTSCVSFGTQWADKNSFIPGLVLPALFAALAIVDLVDRVGAGVRRPKIEGLVAIGLAGAICTQLYLQWYEPKPHLPTAKDHQIATRFIERLRKIDGPLLVPYHPWYPHLAGKRAHYHHMGVNDVTRAGQRYPRGIRESIADQLWSAIVLDNPPAGRYDYALRYYKFSHHYTPADSPRVFSGYNIRPTYHLVPKREEITPSGARRVFGFEDGTFKGWKQTGNAFGHRPVGGNSGNQKLAGPYEGRYLASSFVFGDRRVGTLRSSPFVVDKPVLTYRVGGGVRGGEVRLLVDGEIVHRGKPSRNTYVMQQRRVDVRAHLGKEMVVEVVDSGRSGWGHIYFDDVVLWDS